MTDSGKAERFLAMARAGFEPSARDRERVRRSLGSRLAGVVGVGASVSVAAAATGAASAAGAGTAATTSGATVAAASGAAAAGLGKLFLTSVLWSALGATTLVVAVEAVQQGSNSSVASRSVTAGRAAPSRAAVAHARPRAASATTSAPRKLPDVGSSSKLRESDGSSPVTRQRATPGVANGQAPAENRLKAELELLKQARHASEAGDARATLAALSELDRSFPAGVLLQERAVLRAMATCQAASATARASALSEFERSYPASVYVSKVRASCTESSQSQSSAPSDTHTNDAAGPTPGQ